MVPTRNLVYCSHQKFGAWARSCCCSNKCERQTGGTGYIGKFIVGASVKFGFPTFVLVRNLAPQDPVKAKLFQEFASSGVALIKGDLYDHESLVKAVKQVDVVISAVGSMQLADQTNIIAAIKEAGNIKRFLPSEFGIDVDRAHTVEPATSAFAVKAQIRRQVEKEGIPFTIVCANYFAGYSLPTLAQYDSFGPPVDKLVIYGDGNTKVVVTDEEDIGLYTIKAAVDPRTLNKIVYIRPPKNMYTHNELVSLWEEKTGKKLERIYLTKEEVLQKVQESPFPFNIILAINYSGFVEGDTTNIKIDPSFSVEASEMYRDVEYTTVDEYISRIV